MTQDNLLELLEMFHRAVHLLHRSGPHLRRHGGKKPMPPAQGRLMRVLAATGAVTQRELGEMLDIRSASLSELLGKLEKPGWISRVPNENDKRTITVSLTEEGETMLNNIGNERVEMAEEVFGSLNEEELRQLHSLLGKLIGDWETRFEDEEDDGGRHHRRPRGEGDHGPGWFERMREHIHHHRHHHLHDHPHHGAHGHHGPHDHHHNHGHHDHHDGHDHHCGRHGRPEHHARHEHHDGREHPDAGCGRKPEHSDED